MTYDEYYETASGRAAKRWRDHAKMEMNRIEAPPITLATARFSNDAIATVEATTLLRQPMSANDMELWPREDKTCRDYYVISLRNKEGENVYCPVITGFWGDMLMPADQYTLADMQRLFYEFCDDAAVYMGLPFKIEEIEHSDGYIQKAQAWKCNRSRWFKAHEWNAEMGMLFNHEGKEGTVCRVWRGGIPRKRYL